MHSGDPSQAGIPSLFERRTGPVAEERRPTAVVASSDSGLRPRRHPSAASSATQAWLPRGRLFGATHSGLQHRATQARLPRARSEVQTP